ncbi:ABC transporter ATP-binding protein [Celeribacter indicus]|uniref:Spermidine/putrescine import ATP-binding protein PotA n=1 Tax=Celeribacter indicus TaxID=1208324 RepID=A0A0B5DTZ8_9RHOB|nr:ABC transporter ATP-binding protein [Celeribacter indicus]AJE46933.1 polyamine ABC transporter ATP-binding protein PotG [Celeribacter indicus]SDW78290.1 spermidine/putrescine transport system ATP-binding protein [Celeribacter indicus]
MTIKKRPAGPALITLRNVQKHYGDYHALRGIDLEIGTGEFFSLLGPSGCGKTTLLRTIAGFEDYDSGAVMISGRDMRGVPANKRPTNMVFQSYAIFPHLTVAQNVGFGLRKRDMPKAEKARAVEQALDMVGLTGYGHRAAHALSGGQRQRVALARALVLKPKVLLLDEPLSALDRKMREQMQVELIKLQREVGITFILVTHDQEEALVMSDRIAVMFEGEIAQCDDPEILYRRPKTKRVADFIGVMNFLPATCTQTGGTRMVAVEGLGEAEVTADQCPEGFPEGEATVGFRPETLTILYEGQTATHREASATVEEVVYYGDMTYYDVTFDGVDRPVRLSMRNLFGRDVLDVGTRARISWSPGALVVFPR